jgi:hypothetical protein
VLALAGVIQQVVFTFDSNEFATTGNQTYEEARDVLTSPVVTVTTVLRYIGQFSFGLVVVLISLNAMRAGLLTRFMGILGVIVGVLLVLPIGSPLPVIQAFWFMGLALLISGRWPGGMPGAWASGKAQPWPSLAQQRAQQQDQDNASDAHSEPHIDKVSETHEERIHPSSKKRKRPRRRRSS